MVLLFITLLDVLICGGWLIYLVLGCACACEPCKVNHHNSNHIAVNENNGYYYSSGDEYCVPVGTVPVGKCCGNIREQVPYLSAGVMGVGNNTRAWLPQFHSRDRYTVIAYSL